MQLNREIVVMWLRLRRPAMRVLVGGSLMVPAAVLMAGKEARPGVAPVTIPSVLAAESATRLAADEGVSAAGAEWTEQEIAPPGSAREAAPDWSEALELSEAVKKLEAVEPRLAVASFAQEFRIPVKLAAQIHSAALAENIQPRIAFGLVKAESSFRTRAVSPVGAVGLTQLLPSTARWLVPGTTRRDLMTPETNLRVGFKYLRHLLDQFGGNEKLALTAYNRGPGTVSRLLRRGRDPDNGYAEKVLTGRSAKHVGLMNAKFGSRRRG